MYLITYKKRSGELIYRKRNTLPGYIGQETSMGWIIENIEYLFGNKYYSLKEYQLLMEKRNLKKYYSNKFELLYRKYGTILTLILLIILALIK